MLERRVGCGEHGGLITQRPRRFVTWVDAAMSLGYTWADAARACGPAVEQEGVHGILATGQGDRTGARAAPHKTKTTRFGVPPFGIRKGGLELEYSSAN